jgi:peptidoglycan/xylan/chitin deacetylase (PgdA/CDA1 family)
MSNVKIPILMYHSIELMPRSTVMRSLHVPPKRFIFQMRMLKFLGYKGLSMRNLTPYLNGEKIGKVVGITFDDGYLNNLLNAAPTLNKLGFSATCYLVSEKIGLSNIWDYEKGITQRPLMNHSEVQEWLNLGMDIGAHSCTHPNLDKMDHLKAKEEIQKCKSSLEDYFNISINDFCYPFGKYNESLINFVRNAEYLTATTMNRGKANTETNKLKLPRIPINHHTLPHLFLAKVLTDYEERKR